MAKITLLKTVFPGAAPLTGPTDPHPLVDGTITIGPQADIPAGSFLTGRALGQALDRARGDYILLCLPGGEVLPGSRMLERMLQVAEDSAAGIVYSDFRDIGGDQTADHPLIDYQTGSIRDTFDFGSLVLISRRAIDDTRSKFGDIPEDLNWGAWYDLRLRISVDHPVIRIPEPLYSRAVLDPRATGEKIFDYVDPSKRDFQIEMESIATAHLKRIGAWLPPVFHPVPSSQINFPVTASVIIPVRNRASTIADAVKSALSQKSSFPLNVIVVDNHSTDGTSDILRELASDNERLKVIVPERLDLGIGGCWNEAIYSAECGRYAIQLDSDDIYSSDEVVSRVVEEFERGGYAMVIGSYTIVDFELKEIPPGLIDHREWTRENGRNNALRINGLGAPRAFDTAVLREVGLPNVSYGEDYAVALRLSRRYEIGRIYESLYYARRWSGNSDSALPLLTANRYDAYKDRIRSIEISARRKMGAGAE
ncbi:MAG: glycosyltransferase family 2 protein [Blastocatellales bacterium]